MFSHASAQRAANRALWKVIIQNQINVGSFLIVFDDFSFIDHDSSTIPRELSECDFNRNGAGYNRLLWIG